MQQLSLTRALGPVGNTNYILRVLVVVVLLLFATCTELMTTFNVLSTMAHFGQVLGRILRTTQMIFQRLSHHSGHCHLVLSQPAVHDDQMSATGQ